MNTLENSTGSWVLNESVQSTSLHEELSNTPREAEVPQSDVDSPDAVSDECSEPMYSHNMTCLQTKHVSANQTNDEAKESLTDIAGKYLLKVKEENRLTQTTTQKIAEATSELFSVACRRLKRKVEETLKDANVEQLPGIEDAFEEIAAPFEQLDAKNMDAARI
ncbi:hypothetical protein ACROYT_G032332 [Oculina patagonica]